MQNIQGLVIFFVHVQADIKRQCIMLLGW